MEMTPFLILKKALLGVAKLGDKCQIWYLCQIVKYIYCVGGSFLPIVGKNVGQNIAGCSLKCG